MLYIVSIVAKAGSILYFAYMLIRWVTVVGGFPGNTMPLSFYDPLVNTLVVCFVLWGVGVIASAVGEVLDDSRMMRVIMREVYEERRAAGTPVAPKDMWDEPASQGPRWRNKFGGWRPEKTPITFDDDDYFPPPRRTGTRRVN